MVAKIKSGKSLTGALNYNENKVKQGKVELIDATGYYKDLPDLNFYDKLLRLTDLAERNQRTKTNAVHISLNFANGENLTVATLQAIVREYMQGIGFENQPYLVYRHHDAGHPHIHIVTTNIQRNGERISLHFLGRNQSEKIRKAIELKYRLVKAEDRPKQKPSLAEVKPAEYGKAETKRAITNILGYTLRTYKFTSISELNAVLQQYNITADRGSKDSRMYAKSGLVYWITDQKGNKIGVPIKASSIYGKPTLKTLEDKFRLNETLRKPYKEKLKQAISQAIGKTSRREAFEDALRSKDIQVLFRRNEEDRIYGVTFIDYESKSVFNGSDLGKEYSANPLNERFNQSEPARSAIMQRQRSVKQLSIEKPDDPEINSKLLDMLLQPDYEDISALNKIKREQGKKKRKGLHL